MKFTVCVLAETEDKDGGTRTNSNRSSYGARYRILVGRRHGAVQNRPARIAAGKFGRHATVHVRSKQSSACR